LFPAEFRIASSISRRSNCSTASGKDRDAGDFGAAGSLAYALCSGAVQAADWRVQLLLLFGFPAHPGDQPFDFVSSCQVLSPYVAADSLKAPAN
jgi:hypothetical protein